MGTYHLYGPFLAWIVTGVFLAVLCLVLRILYPEEMPHSQIQDGQKAFLCFVGKLETTSVCLDTSVLGENA